jgi:UDP-3-O-acyl-N-acetylglucosamine deacetylase
VAHKAGHALHTQLVTRLLADHSLWKEVTDPPMETRADATPAAAPSPAHAAD